MIAIFVTICALVVLLGFEVRHRETAEALNELKSLMNKLDDDIVRLKEEMKMKKNVYEEYKPPA